MILIYIILLLVSVIYLWIQHKFQYWKRQGVVHSEPKFPFGNIKTDSILNTITDTYNKFKGKDVFAGLYTMVFPSVLALDLDLISKIMIKDFNIFTNRPAYYNERDDPLSAHLFSIDDKKWKTLRSKLSPTFTSGKMKFMFPTLVKVSQELQKSIDEIIKTNNEIEFKDLLARFSTDVIGTCAFGIDCNSLHDPDAEFRTYGRMILGNIGIIKRIFLINFPNLSRSLHLKIVSPKTAKFFMNVVKETVSFRERNNIKRNDFMDILINMKNNDVEGLGKLSIEEIAAQAFVFFLAGFETSSTNMTFCLYELAKNQEIQNKLRAEIMSVLKKYNNEITYEAVSEMTYLDQIVSETLRKYPSLGVLTRVANKDYQVENTNYVIKKNTIVFIPAYGIHHDESIYPSPESFDPDRFTQEAINQRHSTAFLGFGDGPRNCIGMRFGRMQSRIGLIAIIKNYRVKPSANTPEKIIFDKTSPVLTPKGGLTLCLEHIL